MRHGGAERPSGVLVSLRKRCEADVESGCVLGELGLTKANWS